MTTSRRRLFGTDGVRGVANAELTPELAMALGRALGAVVGAGNAVVIGRDTRRSGPMLEGALSAGLTSAGVDARLVGVLPTPAIAEEVPASGAAGGAIISASHNPFADNGIKLVGSDGFKLADAQEAEVEALMDSPGERPTGGALGSVTHDPGAAERYVDVLCRRFATRLDGLHVVIDCAHGATVTTAPAALERLGARLTVLHAQPDGVNINAGCGSTHLGSLQQAVVAGTADLGLAFDGDGDRVLAVDAAGQVVDGDQILAVLALDMKSRGALPHDTVVTTTMTNLGFRRAMDAQGVHVKWTDVGDRYVLAEMRAGGYVLGGEQSGHLINLDAGPTGDGLASGLMLLDALVSSGRALADAAGVVVRLPQKLVNVAGVRKADLPGAAGVWAEVHAFERAFGDDGRVVVRPSGTEPLVRVMVEAPTEADCDEWCARIAARVDEDLGGG